MKSTKRYRKLIVLMILTCGYWSSNASASEQLAITEKLTVNADPPVPLDELADSWAETIEALNDCTGRYSRCRNHLGACYSKLNDTVRHTDRWWDGFGKGVAVGIGVIVIVGGGVAIYYQYVR